MFAEERRVKIVTMLETSQDVTVKKLSDLFKVSEVIIRKDLQRLEEEKKLKRTHGGAISLRKIVHSSNVSSRLMNARASHKLIAEIAFKQINENETILLDTSASNILLAELIAYKPKKLTVITNMLEVSQILSNINEINLICTGGIYSKILGAFSGGLAIDALSKFNCDKLFLGTAGINLNNGYLSNFDIEEGKTKSAMIDVSDSIYLLADNSKFYQDALYRFAPLAEIDYVITDKIPDNFIGLTLKKLGITVLGPAE